MKYLILIILFLSGCVTKMEVAKISGFQNSELLNASLQTDLDSGDEQEIETVAKEIDPHQAKQLLLNYSKSYYTLQVGAYPSRSIASLSAAKLNLTNSPISIEEAEVNGKKWQRVYVGKFYDKKSAMAFQKKISGDSFVKVIQDQE
jgi:cell division protein FtsN